VKATADAKAAADAQAAAEVKAASDNKATANAKVAAVAKAAAAEVKAAADAKAAAGDKAAPALVGHGTAEAAWAMVPAGSPTPKGQQRGNLCCPSSHIRIHQGSRNLLRALRRRRLPWRRRLKL
jgi:hypothetical protein